MTTRRNFMQGSAAMAGLGAIGLPQIARAAETLTGVTYLPPSYEDLAFGYQGLVDKINENGGDAVSLDFHDSGRLLAADEQLPALRSGNIDFMFHTTSYITRSLPMLGVLGLPGVVGTLYENPDRLKRGSPLFELIAEEIAKQGLTCLTLGGGIMEPEYVWSVEDAPIKSLADVSGKKIRLVSFEATEAMEHFGAAAVRIPSSELYLALERGTVDAAVANISTINGRSIQEQIKYAYKLPVTAFAIGVFVMTKRWEAMPQEVRDAFMTGVEWFDTESARAANEDYFAAKYWPAFEEAGIEIIEPSDEELAEFDQINEDVRDVWLKEVGDEVGRKAIALATGEA